MGKFDQEQADKAILQKNQSEDIDGPPYGEPEPAGPPDPSYFED